MRIWLTALVLVASVTAASADTRSWFRPPPNASVIPVQNLNCGIPPIPPIGCKPPGVCVCDQTGQKCQWQFVCN